MTDYELYTMVERDYFKRGGDTLNRAEWWKKLSRLPLIGRFATKRAEALDAEAKIQSCFDEFSDEYELSDSTKAIVDKLFDNITQSLVDAYIIEAMQIDIDADDELNKAWDAILYYFAKNYQTAMANGFEKALNKMK